MNDMTTIPADEIKRVKGLGFLNNKGTDCFSARVITVNGKITAAQQRCIADAAEAYGNGIVTFTSRMTIEVQGIPFAKIEDFRAAIAKEGLETGGTGAKVRPVVCCKGTTCQFGLIDTFAVSEEIHKRFYKGYRQVALPHKFKIAVGGCPNNCVKPDINDVGVIGQLVPSFEADKCKSCAKCAVETACPIGAAECVDGVFSIDAGKCNNCGRCIEKCPFKAIPGGVGGYKVTIGGRWGKIAERGRALSKIITSDAELYDVIEKCILFYKEKGIAGERFAQTIARIGFEEADREILSGALLERKEEILKA